MKLIWKGRLKDIKELPIGDLPANAVKYKEPKTVKKLCLVANLFTIPVILLSVLAVYVKIKLYANFSFPQFKNYLIGFGLALLTIIPHEYLHAMGFPEDAEVFCYYKPEKLIAFIYSTHPISKRRFIYISLLPNVVSGLIPLLLWVVLPLNKDISEIFFSFSVLSLMFGSGDYINVFNTIKQVPKGAVTQISGFHSYWYYPESTYAKEQQV